MSTHENSAPKQDVYRRVTDSIITAIENGVGQYRMPWNARQDKGFSPVSVGSAKPYRGINTVVLWAQAQSKGYSSALWGTYQQWQSLGGQVRKGEHGSPVVYWGSLKNRQAKMRRASLVASSPRPTQFSTSNKLTVANCQADSSRS